MVSTIALMAAPAFEMSASTTRTACAVALRLERAMRRAARANCFERLCCFESYAVSWEPLTLWGAGGV